jgi:uncharacterized protein (DUF2252 family)
MTQTPAVRRRRSRTAASAGHVEPEHRAERGKAARGSVPRSSHAVVFEPMKSRPDPVALLQSQDVARVPELLPIRYGRMAVSPFTFFRGAALVMAGDLAVTPVSGEVVQLCGDAHLSNFGVFASPERRLVFDVDDFDETLPGPWEWDVKRLAASLEIAGRNNGFSTKERRGIVMAAVGRYRTALREFAGMSNLEVWYARADVQELQTQAADRLDAVGRKRLSRGLAKARTRDSVREFGKLTATVEGERQITAAPPLVVPVRDLFPGAVEQDKLRDQIWELLRGYRRSLESDRRVLVEQFRAVDLARKVVGVGSVGTRCWIVLMLGRDEHDPLFLQVKEAGPSVLEGFAGASEYGNAGQRVVAGQRLVQAASDIFLGWQRLTGFDGQQRDFYVRQLRDWKGSVEVEAMVPNGMQVYGELCGWTLARAHARSGDRIAIAAYLGAGEAFDRAIVEFTDAYADQNERDHQALREAIAAGRVTAEAGV